MLYIGIDLHGKQMTVCVRNEAGDAVLQRQVSTRPEKVEDFIAQMHAADGGEAYTAMLEVCGFHDWLADRLNRDPRCRDVVVIHPGKRSKRKTDRRDASKLSELLWVNRDRLLAGKRAKGVRRVYQPTADERRDRQVTSVRLRAARRRTRTINQIRYILRKNNLEWERPTKTFQTQKVKRWLQTLPLDEIDRLEMNHLLEQWEMWSRQIDELDRKIVERHAHSDAARLLSTIVGVSCYMALAIASRIGDVRRFVRGRSLANFLGLTPGSRSSGEQRRLGSITKEGSRTVRFLLGQLTVHVLRTDGKMRRWYLRIKRRRGAKIARVAVMRRLSVIMWHMLSKQEEYRYGGLPQNTRRTAEQDAEREAARERTDAMRAEIDSLAASARTAESTGSSSLSRRKRKTTPPRAAAPTKP